MKFIYFFCFIVVCATCRAQTTTTIITRPYETNTGYGGAYVAPVVTKTYTIKSDPYVWDKNKNSFGENSLYIATEGSTSQGSGATTSSGFTMKKARWQVRIDKLNAENRNRQIATNSSNASMLEITNSIVNEIDELAKKYEEGKYLDAYSIVQNIQDMYFKVFAIRNEMSYVNGVPDIPGMPNRKVSNIEKYYTMLTLNKVGANNEVINAYLSSYTNCFNPDNGGCYDYIITQKTIKPPFIKACDIRECPEKIRGIEGLSMEDIFVIELTFTESAAILGYIDYANENFKSVMNYYTGKIVLSPYYLDLSSAVIALGQPEYAAKFFDQYKLEYGSEPEGKMQIKSYLLKIGAYYILKGEQKIGKSYFEAYLATGNRTIEERQAFIEILKKNSYTNARENKLITAFIAIEMDSLIADKNFSVETGYCRMLNDRSLLFMKNKQYTEARKIMDLGFKACSNLTFSRGKYYTLRCLTGEADKVMAEYDLYFNKRNTKGDLLPISSGVADEAKAYMIILNDAGLYEKCLTVFNDMKDRNIGKKFDTVYNALLGEACIAYYNLRDYKNARKCIGNMDNLLIKYERYSAKLYAMEGDKIRAQKLYKKISFVMESEFDEEDLRFMEQ